MKKYSSVFFMIGLAMIFMITHLWIGWEGAVDDAREHGQAALFGDYLKQWLRDTAENLQSEFWQLAVQFSLLAGLFEFMKVRVYEEDQEEIKERLQRIEELIQR